MNGRESDDLTAPSFLEVGSALQLNLRAEGHNVQCGSTLLGWKEGAWLICEWPFQLGEAVACEPSAPCVVRYFLAGKLIGFRSEVRTATRTPVPLLFLAYPKQVEQVLVRKHLRVPSHEPLLLLRVDGDTQGHHAPSGPLLGGILRDLSISGCRAALVPPLQNLYPDTAVRLEFALPGIGHVSNLAGIVKNVSEQPDCCVVGIEFRFNQMEYIEYRGWGGTVQKAIELFVFQKQPTEKL
ncbi:MAG: flagellar brake protein [Nitrospirota bacterium]